MKRMKCPASHIWFVRGLLYSSYIHQNRTPRRALNISSSRHSYFSRRSQNSFPVPTTLTGSRVNKCENYEGSNCISAQIYFKIYFEFVVLVDHGGARFDSFSSTSSVRSFYRVFIRRRFERGLLSVGDWCKSTIIEFERG
jgi:hypothetical protein